MILSYCNYKKFYLFVLACLALSQSYFIRAASPGFLKDLYLLNETDELEVLNPVTGLIWVKSEAHAGIAELSPKSNLKSLLQELYYRNNSNLPAIKKN